VKNRPIRGFGSRLAAIRASRGFTQNGLARKLRVSRRLLAYYERDDAQPPGALLVALSGILSVSADELLGLLPHRRRPSRKVANLVKRFERVFDLPDRTRRELLGWLDNLIDGSFSILAKRRARLAQARRRRESAGPKPS
jgi:transcriptional regulator with XRE-family HTH domain